MNGRYALGMALAGIVGLIGLALLGLAVADGVNYAMNGDTTLYKPVLLGFIGAFIAGIGVFLGVVTTEAEYDY